MQIGIEMLFKLFSKGCENKGSKISGRKPHPDKSQIIGTPIVLAVGVKALSAPPIDQKQIAKAYIMLRDDDELNKL